MGVPDLPEQPADPILFSDPVGLDPLARQVLLLVVPDGDDATTTGAGAGMELPECREDVLIGEEMGNGVVAGHHDIELRRVMVMGLAHVSHGETDGESPLGRFAGGPVDLFGREIRRRDRVAEPREPERLGPDAAGNVEHARHISPGIADRGVEHLGLAPHAPLPIRVDEVIEGR